MAHDIDWMYFRRNCDTCKKAAGYLQTASAKVNETVDAVRIRKGPDEALRLLEGLERMVACKGRNRVVFDLKTDRPDDETLLKHLIGPTGNLRAPTMIVGTTLLVGFQEDAYQDVIG